MLHCPHCLVKLVFLSVEINIGCRLSYKFRPINHLLFADDAVVSKFAPSAKGLQQLLDVCSKVASSHNVIFNVTKSQCLIVKFRSDIISCPMFRVCWASLPYTDSYKYLGHIINSVDADMMRQARALYARANTIIRKFSFASLSRDTVLC